MARLEGCSLRAAGRGGMVPIGPAQVMSLRRPYGTPWQTCGISSSPRWKRGADQLSPPARTPDIPNAALNKGPEMGLLQIDGLIKQFEVYVSSTVASEVKHYLKADEEIQIDFRTDYIQSDKVKEVSATIDAAEEMLRRLPHIMSEAIDPGEIESLAIMCHEDDFIFCTCDGAAIRCLPFLDLAERAKSMEALLKECGITTKNIADHQREKAFKNILGQGHIQKICSLQLSDTRKKDKKKRKS